MEYIESPREEKIKRAVQRGMLQLMILSGAIVFILVFFWTSLIEHELTERKLLDIIPLGMLL